MRIFDSPLEPSRIESGRRRRARVPPRCAERWVPLPREPHCNFVLYGRAVTGSQRSGIFVRPLASAPSYVVSHMDVVRLHRDVVGYGFFRTLCVRSNGSFVVNVTDAVENILSSHVFDARGSFVHGHGPVTYGVSVGAAACSSGVHARAS